MSGDLHRVDAPFEGAASRPYERNSENKSSGLLARTKPELLTVKPAIFFAFRRYILMPHVYTI
jgi:hypothetical protein